jgi:hypothetical protein
LYRFTTKDLDELKLLSPATHYASTSKIQLDDFKLCPKAHRDNGHLVSSATFLMFQYNKYMVDLVNRRRVASQEMGTGITLDIPDADFDAVLHGGEDSVSNTATNVES